ncbi:MAG: PEP-CTERM sorting domain-containing protein [Ignavibacteriaceae bacterium]|nr:PEP-CTERM sorting domain-containing protein [Ignavibacteriaceae bacterium]
MRCIHSVISPVNDEEEYISKLKDLYIQTTGSYMSTKYQCMIVVRNYLIVLAMLALSTNGNASPIHYVSVSHLSEIQNALPESYQPTAEMHRQLELFVVVFDSSYNTLIDDVEVSAVNSSDPTTEYSLGLMTDPLFNGGFLLEVPFATHLADGIWTVTAKTLDGDSITTTRGPYTPDSIIDPLTPISIDGPTLTPTIGWVLPDQEIDAMIVRIIDESLVDDSNYGHFYQQTLSPSATSFVVPDGVLASNGNYTFRVLADDHGPASGDGRVRSGYLMSYSTIPVPATIALLAAGLLGLGFTCRRHQSKACI